MPAPWMAGEHRRIDESVVQHDRDAAERARLVEPGAAQRVEQERARQIGSGVARALERVGTKRAEQRWRRRAGPERGSGGADHATGLVVGARRSLDLDVEREAVAQAERGDGGEARGRLAGKARAVPAAGVEARQRAPRQRRRRAASRGRSLAASRRGAGTGRRRRELHVAFERAIAVRRADAKRRQRVLWRELAGAAMRDPARVGPGCGHGVVAATLARAGSTRSDVAASNQCRCAGVARRPTISSIFGYGMVASRRAVKSVSPSTP